MAGGAADRDGRLQIGDEISHINDNSVINASHREVIGLMGDAAALGDVVLGIRRRMPMSESVPLPSSQDHLRGRDAEQGKHPEERGTSNGTPLMENAKSPFLSDSNFSVFRFLGYYNFGGFTANSLAQYLLKDVEFFYSCTKVNVLTSVSNPSLW